jgi:uncharacterized protein YbaP (TraB family)
MRACWSRMAAAGVAAWLMAWSGVGTAQPAEDSSAKQPAQESSGKQPARTEAAGPDRGFLWKVEKSAQSGAATLYLYGTIHVGKPAFYPLGPAAGQALQASDAIALEADVSNPLEAAALVQQRGMYAEPQALRAKLAPAARTRLSKACSRIGLPEEMAWQIKPVMLAVMLGFFDAQRMGYHAMNGVEMYLANIARTQGKPIVEVEGLEAQFALFERVPERQAIAMLNESVQDILSGRSRRDIQELVKVWLAGDLAGLEGSGERAINRPGAMAGFMAEELLEKRNRGMADKAESYLKSGRTHFMAVGALHLVGESGLPALLARRGYRVTRQGAGS